MQQHIQSCEGVDRGAIDRFSQVNVFVGAVRDGEQAGTEGIRWDSLGRIETRFEQARTHFEARRVAGYGLHAASECFTQRFVRRKRAATGTSKSLAIARQAR